MILGNERWFDEESLINMQIKGDFVIIKLIKELAEYLDLEPEIARKLLGVKAQPHRVTDIHRVSHSGGAKITRQRVNGQLIETGFAGDSLDKYKSMPGHRYVNRVDTSVTHD